MARIPDHFLDCSIYLYPSSDAALAGHHSGGSGFLVGVPCGVPDQSVTVAVTNRHVIEIGAPVIRLNNLDGTVSIYEAEEPNWIFPKGGLDLAVLPIPVVPGRQRFKRVGYTAIMSEETAREWDIGPGTDTFLVGRFIESGGIQTNQPSVRFGTVAQMPLEYPNEFGRPQESFLVETRSVGGYSGSPVFAHIPPFMKDMSSGDLDGSYWGPALLGVNWGHATRRDPILDPAGRETGSGQHVRSQTGMAMVIPAWRLLKFLNSKPVRDRVMAMLG